MNPTHDPMTYPLPRLRAFSLNPHHIGENGRHTRMVTLNNKEASIVRFTLMGVSGSYGSGEGLYEIMYSDGDDVKGYCDMSEVSAIIYTMSLETD